ncbi:hypothetical protein C5E10_02915 [Pseudoclavibacter sp. RFBG4]|uniref:glycosyltransferase family 4 protein n=1 Tax=Pseudoclavibacter sp. RFBG4 TaxID=2080575 RepID=UPI000CE722FF|nr:glycosyltransferase family 4 protein [Pseudoclavibacter sp. RFBG4]PPG35703.1 hypothetical protein C5E10_02915 [Pseudoclavibacter sp. RFBG4]
MSQVMKVAHLDHVNTNGGAELALARMLQGKPSWRPLVILPKRSNDENAVFTDGRLHEEVGVLRIGPQQPVGASNAGGIGKLAGMAIRLLGQALVLRPTLRRQRVEVVHANSTRSAIYGVLAVLGSRRTFVVHLRDMITPESIGGAGHALFTRLALRRADGVIANSSATLDSARSSIREATAVAVIPSAAGIARIEADSLPDIAAGERIRCIGMVARIDPWKGQELLVRALARADLSADCRLMFAGGAPFGNEPYLEELRALAAELGIADRVDFCGHVRDVNSFIDGLDVCVQASIRPEPLGQNVLQYLSRGRATIVADEGGPTEWVTDGENGLTFRSGSEEDLALQIDRLDQDASLRKALGRAAVATDGLADDQEIANLHLALFADARSRRAGR